jgi:hypothetical protein
MRVWVPRILALLALAGAVVGVYAAIASVERTDELTVEEAQEVTARLNAANRELGRLLTALEPGVSPREAQASTRTAADLTRELLEDGGDEGSLADRLDAVLRAELAYLDAIGSTLNNPRSELRGAIRQRGVDLREQLQNIPGGDAKLVRGGAELVAYSEARLAD